MRKVLLALVALVYSECVLADNFAAISVSLREDITLAQQRLATSERRIADASAQAYTRISEKQRKVSALRERVAVARRLADEQTLGLEQLQTRLNAWRDQHQYQKYLLTDFVEQVSVSSELAPIHVETVSAGLDFVRQRLRAKQQLMNPRWQPVKIVSADGSVTAAEALTLGPVTWFWQAGTGYGGLAVPTEQGLYTVQHPFQGAELAQLAELYQRGQARVSFDPTLDRALKIAKQDESLLEHLQKGGVWAVPILVFAALALVIATVKLVQLSRLPKLQPMLAERIAAILKPSLNIHALRELRGQLRGAEAELVAITFDTPVSQQRDERLFACLIEHRRKLDQFLGAIAVTAAVAPLLGLLGTVSGMIETFKMMTIFGAGEPSAVSGGISEALVTTELGLVVAIPALIFHALLSRHVNNYNARLETTAIKLGQLDWSPDTPREADENLTHEDGTTPLARATA